MKTQSYRSRLLVGVAFLAATGLAIPAIAAPAPHSEHAVIPCTDARVVSVTETKSILANGRGPTRTVTIGQKLACTSCDTPMMAMKPSGHNARGAMAPVAIKGTHDCTMSGCTPTSRVARVD